jgi:WD40 repeat protein
MCLPLHYCIQCTDLHPLKPFDCFSCFFNAYVGPYTVCISASRFAAVDARGAVYIFHLRANRFSLAHNAGQEVTAMAFSSGRDNDLFLGLADHSIRIISSDSGATRATLKSHRQAVCCISPHPNGRFLVSCSLDACMLWDLKSLKRMQNIGSSGRYSVYLLD